MTERGAFRLRKPVPTPTPEEVRESVRQTVNRVVKPFARRVEAQRSDPNVGKIQIK